MSTNTHERKLSRRDRAPANNPKEHSSHWSRRQRPVHGPYAEVWFDEAAGLHRIRLTNEGREKAAEYLKRYPHPIGLLISVWPSAYRAARAVRLTDQEIDALCLEGVALAFARYDPTRGAAVGTAIVWGLRATVGNAIRQAKRIATQLLVDFRDAASRSADRVSERAAGGNLPVEFWRSLARDGQRRLNDLGDDVDEFLSEANLTEKELAVLRLRFGLGETPARKGSSIAQSLGISAERVRQIHERAIRKIRLSLGLDINWETTARCRVLGCLKGCAQGITKSQVCKRSRVPMWQLRAIMPSLLEEGLVIRERKAVSNARWCLMFRSASSIEGGLLLPAQAG